MIDGHVTLADVIEVVEKYASQGDDDTVDRAEIAEELVTELFSCDGCEFYAQDSFYTYEGCKTCRRNCPDRYRYKGHS